MCRRRPPRWTPSRRCAPGSAGRSWSTCAGATRTSSRWPRPGAGKTTFALRIAAELLGRRHRRRGHRGDADRASQGPVGRGRGGGRASSWTRPSATPTCTPPPTSTAPSSPTPRWAWRRWCTAAARWPGRPWSILDEIHHAGDSRSWGDGVAAAFEPAVRRLMLTGTPFRSDENPIPFVTYERGARRAAAVALRLLVRVRRRPGRRRGPPGDLPGVLGRDPLAHLGRRRADRPAGRADDPGRGRRRPGGPRWTRPVTGCRRCCGPPTPGCRCYAHGRHPGRRRAGHRDRPADRPGVREAAERHHR